MRKIRNFFAKLFNSLKDKTNIIIFTKQCGSRLYGSIAQLGEHLPYKQRVIGSSPIVPTKRWPGSSAG